MHGSSIISETQLKSRISTFKAILLPHHHRPIEVNMPFYWAVALTKNDGESRGFLPMATESRERLVILCSVFLVPATVSVFARFYSRTIKDVKLALDDWLAAVGLVGFITAFICCLIIAERTRKALLLFFHRSADSWWGCLDGWKLRIAKEQSRGQSRR